MRKRKEIVAIILALALFLSLSWAAAWLLMPVRTEYGSMWDAYRQEERDSIDLLVMGSSFAYCDIIPAYLWGGAGVRSYVMAGPKQTPAVSYYYIREACKTQSPRYLMLELTGMFFEKYEEYAFANVSYMPLSANRIGAAFAGAPQSDRLGLLFPLYAYHSRWTEVETPEITAHLHPQSDALAGYTLLTTTEPIEADYEREFTAESTEYKDNLQWLGKIADYCEKNGIELMPFIAPSTGKIPPAALETLRGDVAALGLTLTDFNEIIPELEIDYSTDWYDPRHFNLRGAVKFSRWLGEYLSVECGVTPTAEADAELWNERLQYVEDARAALNE